MRLVMVVGWVVSLAGIALWVYGLYVAGHPPLLDWPSFAPSWIADFLPNLESEIGLVLSFAGMIPVYAIQIFGRR